jgi:hypothetical protein
MVVVHQQQRCTFFSTPSVAATKIPRAKFALTSSVIDSEISLSIKTFVRGGNSGRGYPFPLFHQLIAIFGP